MVTASTSSPDPAPSARLGQPSLRALVLKHRWIAVGALVLVLLFGVLLIPEIVTAGRWKVTDSTSCSAWSSANSRQQAAYARLYVRRHGSLENGATSPAAIEGAINNACLQAFAYDEADNVTVLQAINGQY